MNQMTRIAKAPPDGRKAWFTTAEFLRMVELDAFGDARVELIDGELERMPPAKRRHSLLQSSILAQLVAIVGIERACVEIGIELGDDTVLGADIAILRAPMIDNRWPRPDEVLLTVEVSETTLGRDLGMKAPRYAAAGIPHCWVVDGAARVVHAYADPREGSFAESSVVRFGEPVAVPGTDASITLA